MINLSVVGWLVVLRINVDLAIFQPYLDLEAGDNQSLKIQVARPGIEPGPLAPQAKSLTTRPPLLYVLFKKYLCIYLFASHTNALDDSVTRSTDTSFFLIIPIHILYINQTRGRINRLCFICHIHRIVNSNDIRANILPLVMWRKIRL